jgi:hypothetical protein
MKRVPVTSEALRSVGYESGTLELEFADGDVYRYFAVPEAEYAQFMLSESMGRYVVENIRESYPYARLA